jgi:transcriptional regulator GlxA family with amidase domain
MNASAGQSEAKRSVVILVFDDVEVLDFCGPFEVFSIAGNLSDPAAFEVALVAEKQATITARNGLKVLPDFTFANCPESSLLLVPGGQGTRREMYNPILVDWVRNRSLRSELVLSVCTGALILGQAGLLDGIESTTHHRSFDLLRETSPGTSVVEKRRYVDSGTVVTSGGIAAGIDMALHVVRRLDGVELARRTAAHMEYPFSSD